jgi:hypothetical protein
MGVPAGAAGCAMAEVTQRRTKKAEQDFMTETKMAAE